MLPTKMTADEQRFQDLLKTARLKTIERQLQFLGTQMGVKVKLKKDGEVNLRPFAHSPRLKQIVLHTRNIQATTPVKKTTKRATLDDVNADTITSTTTHLANSQDNIAITVNIPVSVFVDQLLNRLKTA